MPSVKPEIGSKNKVFYFTDIHGHLHLCNYIINYCNTLDPDCAIIFGGDACDRGIYGYEIMKVLLNSENIIYLKGNHEDMFVKAAKEFMEHFPAYGNMSLETITRILKGVNIFDNKYPALQIYLYNGGKETLIDWLLKEPRKEEFVERINSLPLTYSYKNIDFCHAGGVYPSFTREQKNELDMESILWNRTAFDYGWAPNRICIHGHTPTPAMPKRCGGRMPIHEAHPLKYRGDFDDKYTGYKINMDTGVFASGRIFILDCCNLIATGFYDHEINDTEKLAHNIEKLIDINLS